MHAGVPDGRARRGPDRRGGRVPRARLGPGAVDDGRAPGRQRRGPHDLGGARRAGRHRQPAGSADSRPRAPTLRGHFGALRPPGRHRLHRGATGRAGQRLDAHAHADTDADLGRRPGRLRPTGLARAPVRLRPQPPSALGAADVAVGEPFSFEGRTGRRIHGLVYRPTLAGTVGPPDALPPLVVACHSGPTGSVGAGFDVVVQYFTSRGFALAAVDYAGSTGYGRDYRCSLWGQWGVARLRGLRRCGAVPGRPSGRVDGTRMAVRGTSSGGLTALNALADGGALRRRGLLVRRERPVCAGRLDPRLRGALYGSAGGPAARVPGDVRGPIAGGAGGRDQRRGPAAPGPGRPRRPAGPDRAPARCAAGPRPPLQVRFFEGEGHGFRRAETLEACLEEELAFYRRELHL